jgi:cytidylate kinase
VRHMKEIFTIDHALSYQEGNWKQRKKTVNMSGKRALPFVTISREFGCLGYFVGQSVAAILNKDYRHEPLWTVFDKNILDRLVTDFNISYELAETLTEKAKGSMADYFRMSFSKYPPEAVVYRKLVETMRIIAANGHAVIIGRVSNVVTRDLPKGYHVRITASTQKKIRNISKQFDITQNEAKKIVEKGEEDREKFLLKRLKVDMTKPTYYDLLINTTDYTTDETAQLIIKGMESAGLVSRKS